MIGQPYDNISGLAEIGPPMTGQPYDNISGLAEKGPLHDWPTIYMLIYYCNRLLVSCPWYLTTAIGFSVLPPDSCCSLWQSSGIGRMDADDQDDFKIGLDRCPSMKSGHTQCISVPVGLLLEAPLANLFCFLPWNLFCYVWNSLPADLCDPGLSVKSSSSPEQ